MHQLKGKGKRLPSLETVFATIVIAACFLSIFIANISQRTHKRSHQADIVGKNTEFKSKFGHYDVKAARRVGPKLPGHPIRKVKPNPHVNISKKQTVKEIALDLAEEAADSSPYRWFNPLPVVSISPQLLQSKHPYFKGYVIENGDHCKNQRVDILIYFHSEAGHFNSRLVQRQTWAGRNNFKDIRVKTVFFLGEAARAEDAPGVPLEFSTHGDIVQGDFPDTFKNLSIKAIMASHWILRHCSHARYIIKADDDMFLDIFRVVEKLVPQIHESQKTFMCPYQKNNSKAIQRDPNNKWYVPEKLLAKRKYHTEFCSGYVLLFTTDLIPILYSGSLKAELVPIDDVFLFGLSIDSSRSVKFINIGRNVSLSQDTMMQQFKRNTTPTFIATQVNNDDGLRALWRESVIALTPWGLERASLQLFDRRLEWLGGKDAHLNQPKY